MSGELEPWRTMPEVGASTFDLPNKGGPGPDMETLFIRKLVMVTGAV